MIAIISDIHGNFEALKAITNEIKRLSINKIICLGDICGYYSEVNECLELVKSLTENVVIGNHDYYIISNTKCPRSNSANDCLDFQRKIIKPKLLSWLASKPQQAVYYGINCVHGGWNNYLDEYINENSFADKEFEEKLLASGHSHKPEIRKFEDYVYCNPGSVGQPRDGDNRASFAVFKNGQYEIIRVKYDYTKTQNKMKECGFSEYYYKNLEYGLKIGEQAG